MFIKILRETKILECTTLGVQMFIKILRETKILECTTLGVQIV
jgi:hypothetical protein